MAGILQWSATMKHRIAIACAALLAGCIDFGDSNSGCEGQPPACVNDFECPVNSICESFCVPAQECRTADDCAEGQICEQRPSDAPQDPFDSPPPGKKVCGGSTVSTPAISSVVSGTGGAAGGGASATGGNADGGTAGHNAGGAGGLDTGGAGGAGGTGGGL
jgi:hypothetical protein